ncbi:MAG: thioredoxin family protein [Endomicrobia bacterium]|nr:thioredoxin family protein [Endomicrobiia bacterium]MDW8056501.1 thioredoxin family protein [Elusimicrobiota bacterium]
MRIIVAGRGCQRCITTEDNVKKACREIGLADVEIIHITDPKEFIKLGVIVTPAVIIDGKVVFSGKVPSVEEIKEVLLKK